MSKSDVERLETTIETGGMQGAAARTPPDCEVTKTASKKYGGWKARLHLYPIYFLKNRK